MASLVLLTALGLACPPADAAGATDAPASTPVPVAVLGDSDSHSYQDREHFPLGTPQRGGPYRLHTLQWTEVLARLRAGRIDLGAWQDWGTSAWQAAALDLANQPTRAPRKQDYRFNYAVTGATCEHLFSEYREAPRLVRLMDDEPDRWRDGVVVIRIGINSLGKEEQMQAYARDGLTPLHQSEVNRCISLIGEAVHLIRSHHAGTHIVLVGILNNVDWPPNFARWHSPRELANIGAVLDAFDHGLMDIAQRRSDVAFFDDRANFRRHWGGRSADGRPAYTSVDIAGRWRVGNTQGDAPHNGVVADGHAGTITNALWARDLIDFMNQRFGLKIPAVSDQELARFLTGVLPPPGP